MLKQPQGAPCLIRPCITSGCPKAATRALHAGRGTPPLTIALVVFILFAPGKRPAPGIGPGPEGPQPSTLPLRHASQFCEYEELKLPKFAFAGFEFSGIFTDLFAEQRLSKPQKQRSYADVKALTAHLNQYNYVHGNLKTYPGNSAQCGNLNAFWCACCGVLEQFNNKFCTLITA